MNILHSFSSACDLKFNSDFVFVTLISWGNKKRFIKKYIQKLPFRYWLENEANLDFLRHHFNSIGVEVEILKNWLNDFASSLENYKMGG